MLFGSMVISHLLLRGYSEFVLAYYGLFWYSMSRAVMFFDIFDGPGLISEIIVEFGFVKSEFERTLRCFKPFRV